jgi:hypothetical protein
MGPNEKPLSSTPDDSKYQVPEILFQKNEEDEQYAKKSHVYCNTHYQKY